MSTFLSAVFLIYGSMHVYGLRKLWAAVPHSPGLAFALVLVGILLTFSPLVVWFLEKRNWHPATAAAAWVSYTWMGYLFLFVCGGVLFDLARALAKLLGLGWPTSEAGALGFVALLALAALVYGFVEARQLCVEEVTIATPKRVSGQLTIVQLSDLHLGAMRGARFLDRVVAKLHEIKPDIVVATGDLVDGQGDNLGALAARLRAYTPALGAYAVTGNHESYAGLDNALRFLRSSGFTVLRGEWARAGGIVIAGVDDPSVAPREARHDGVPASVAADAFIVLLKHQPVIGREPFDLQLSGHVHGGQIFPFVYLTRLAYHARTGLTRLPGGRLLYVSRGAGTWGPPIRLFAPPEITRITLHGIEH
jgi:hypothetical protein